MRKKICFIITSRAQYARTKLLMRLINQDPVFRLQVIVGGSALLRKYGEIISDLKNNSFHSVDKLYTTIEGGNNISMAKTTGLAMIEFTTSLQRLNPDIVIVIGDRFEVLAAVIAAAYLNKIVVHIEGGDVSGTIDESVRHAVTKFSHIHFVTNEFSKERLLKMGENPADIYNVGSLDIEFLNHLPDLSDFSFINKDGVGSKINFNQPFIIVIQHPVTTGEDNFKNVKETLKAVEEMGIQTIWFWPNIDAGTDDISWAIRTFREFHHSYKIRFITHLPPIKFINLLKRAVCLVGNSSAGIKECSYLGIPVVDIGTRQQDRLAAENVVNVGYNFQLIKEAIRAQLNHGPYPSSHIYFKEGTSKHIAEILKKAKPSIQKKFFDNKLFLK